MSCCNNGSTPEGDCSAALTQLVRLCQKWYGTPQSLDLVDGQELSRVLENYGTAINQVKVALAQIMGPDCRLADELVLCRNLAEEVGSACLTGGFPPAPPVPPGPQPGGPVLDYPGLDAAFSGFSLRQLRTAYTGHLIEIRRASDNATTDIDPGHNGLVDLDAIVAFSQGSDCFVTGWYDQGQDDVTSLYQPDPSRQGQIYDNITGFVTNSANALAVRLDGLDDFWSAPFSPLSKWSSRMLVSLAAEAAGGSGDVLWSMDGTVPGGVGGFMLIDTWGTDKYRSYVFGKQIFTAAPIFNTTCVVSVGGEETGGQKVPSIRRNGREDQIWTPIPSVFAGFARATLGANNAGTNYFDGYISECIYYDDVEWREVLPELGVELVEALETNMMQTWGVTPAV